MTRISTLKYSAIKLDNLVPYILAVIIAVCSFLTGCGDDGTGYELIPGPGQATGGDGGAGGSGTLNPPGSAGSGGNPSSCQHVPYKIEMISYNGCMTSPRMTGLISDKLDGTPFEAYFKGKNFATSNGGAVAGQTFVLTKPSPNECGPALLAMVSNSGSIDIKVYRNSAGDPEDMEFYLLQTDLMDEVWLETHNGSAPSADDYYGLEFNELMLNVFDCYKNVECALVKDLNSRGKSLPPGIVIAQAVTNEVLSDGAFCGRMLVVAKSRP